MIWWTYSQYGKRDSIKHGMHTTEEQRVGGPPSLLGWVVGGRGIEYSSTRRNVYLSSKNRVRVLRSIRLFKPRRALWPPKPTY